MAKEKFAGLEFMKVSALGEWAIDAVIIENKEDFIELANKVKDKLLFVADDAEPDEEGNERIIAKNYAVLFLDKNITLQYDQILIPKKEYEALRMLEEEEEKQLLSEKDLEKIKKASLAGKADLILKLLKIKRQQLIDLTKK